MQTEGVGMHPISHLSPLGETSAIDILEDESSSGSSSDGAETDSEGSSSSSEEEDDENERAIAETSTDDETEPTTGDYFGQVAPALPNLDTDAPPAQPGSKPLSPVLEPGAEPVLVPDIVVAQDEATPVSTPTGSGLVPASAIPPSRRGLSLPGFLRRNSSSRSVSSANVSASEGGGAADSDASAATATGGRHKIKRRFSRKKENTFDGDVSGEASSSSLAKPPKLKKKHRRKHRAERKSDASGGLDGGDKPKRKKLGKRRASHYTYENDNDDVLGLVQIEINSANLPRFSNMFKTGFDCDP